MEEYVGCKVKRTDKYIKLTQPVKTQQFNESFGYNGGDNRPPETPAKPGSVLAINAQGDEPLKK